MSAITSGQPRALKRRKTRDRPEKLTVGQYLLKRLSQIGITHLFLTPDPQLERFHNLIETHPKINLVSNPVCSSAGEMADGFGKAKGISAMATSHYGGDVLDILMRANYESVPLVLIFGTKGVQAHPEFETLPQDEGMSFLVKLFRQYSVSWTELSDPKLAAKKIDRVIDYCLFYKKPVCIELPQEVVDCYIPEHLYRSIEFGASDSDTLEEALLELQELLIKAKYPLLYLDRATIAHKADALLLHFAERWHIPYTLSPFAKNFLLEAHPNYCGPLTQALIEQSDLLIEIGENSASKPYKGHKVCITPQSLYIDQRQYPQLLLKEVILALCSLEPNRRHKLWHESVQTENLREDILIISRDATLLDKMAPIFTGEVISSTFSSPHYSFASAIGVAKAIPYKRAIVLLSESDLRASLSELYIVHEECLPFLICVEGDASWVKGLFPDISVYRRKIIDAPANELVIISLA